jgi:hypothetical protein
MASEEMLIAIPVPRDRTGRIALSDAQWSARLNRAIVEATEHDGGVVAWRFDRVVGSDEKGSAVVRLQRRQDR